MERKEAIEAIKKNWPDSNFMVLREALGTLIPELKESEDEKIRNVLVYYFKKYKEQEECGIKTFFGIPTDNIIAWLEKKGEQKPRGKSALEAIKEEKIDNANKVEQNPAWSEEDKKMIDAALQAAHEYGLHGLWFWLKCLKERVLPQNTWKPSDEQIKAVKEAACYSSVFSEKTIDNLISLSKDLKKLKG